MKFELASMMLSNQSIIIGLTIGLFIPLISNILPVRQALQSDLNKMLGAYKRSFGEMTVRIVFLSEYGVNLTQLMAGVLLTVLGFVSYYMAPTAFLVGDLKLAFIILNMLLLLSIVGLVFLTSLIQPHLETLIVHIQMEIFCFDKKLK